MTGLKRVTVVLLALVVIGSSLFAQGVKEEAKGQVTLNVLNYIDMSEPNSANEVRLVWEKFEKENPDIKIVREDLFNEPFHYKTSRTRRCRTWTTPDRRGCRLPAGSCRRRQWR